jgi:hypothetical protein
VTQGGARRLRVPSEEARDSGGHVLSVCVFITAVPITKLFARGEWDSVCRIVVLRLTLRSVCTFIIGTAVPIIKLFAWGESHHARSVLLLQYR